MMKPLDLSQAAPWRQRFTADKVLWGQIARQNPEQGLACTNHSGALQLYAWEVSTGRLTQLTNTPTGRRQGLLSADGRGVYYLADDQGNEIGHLVRLPITGGEPMDLTPEVPPYAMAGLGQSHDGRRLGLMTADKSGFTAHILDCSPGDTSTPPRAVWHAERRAVGPVMTADGTFAAVATTERTGTNAFSLIVFNTATGEILGELFDEDSSLQLGAFVPLAGDTDGPGDTVPKPPSALMPLAALAQTFRPTIALYRF